MLLPQKAGNYTYADYFTWPEGERCKIIDGMAYMQAASSPVHKEVLNGINVQFYILPKIPMCMI